MATTVTIERRELRRLAIEIHVRLAYGGGTIPNGGSCKICKGEWGHNHPEHHAITCPLYPEVSAAMALDPAIKLQRAEERLCECGAAGSGEGHAPECPAAKFDKIPRTMTAANAIKRLGIK